MIRIALVAALLPALATCGSAGPDGGHHASASGAALPATMQDAPVPAGTPGAQPRTSDVAPDFSGIGPLRFGMTAVQMRDAWGRPLYGNAPANDPQACYYLSPRRTDRELHFMVEGDRFVRIDAMRSHGITAPGGGRIGMSTQQIGKLYAGRVTSAPDKYNPDARVLRLTPRHADNERLIFDTDAAGTVQSWRIGVVPQIDYVEGCS